MSGAGGEGEARAGVSVPPHVAAGQGCGASKNNTPKLGRCQVNLPSGVARVVSPKLMALDLVQRSQVSLNSVKLQRSPRASVSFFPSLVLSLQIHSEWRPFKRCQRKYVSLDWPSWSRGLCQESVTIGLIGR